MSTEDDKKTSTESESEEINKAFDLLQQIPTLLEKMEAFSAKIVEIENKLVKADEDEIEKAKAKKQEDEEEKPKEDEEEKKKQDEEEEEDKEEEKKKKKAADSELIKQIEAILDKKLAKSEDKKETKTVTKSVDPVAPPAGSFQEHLGTAGHTNWLAEAIERSNKLGGDTNKLIQDEVNNFQIATLESKVNQLKTMRDNRAKLEELPHIITDAPPVTTRRVRE